MYIRNNTTTKQGHYLLLWRVYKTKLPETNVNGRKNLINLTMKKLLTVVELRVQK